MSYDLVVWIGERPASDREAARTYDALMEVYEESPRRTDDRIRAFVADLVARHPEGQDDGPWSAEPVLEEESGDLAYLTVTFSGIERVEPDVRELADQHGLVAYDPQREGLLGSEEEHRAETLDPDSPVTIDQLSEILNVNARKVQRYASRIDATAPLDFTEALTISLMHPDDRLVADDQWLDVLAAVRMWWATPRAMDTPCMLGVGPRGVSINDLSAGSLIAWEIAGYARRLIKGG